MSAPSFSSFPDFDAEPDTRDKKTEKKLDKKHREEKKNRDSDGRSSKKRHESRHHSRHRDSSEKKNEKEQSLKAEDASKDYRLFFIDIRGDSGNVQYGSIHSGDIPRYRLVNGGRNILGLPLSLVALRREGKGLEIGTRSSFKGSDLTTSSARSLLLQPPAKRLVPAPTGSKYQEIDGFIRLSSRSSKGKRDFAPRLLDQGVETDSESNEESESDEEDGERVLSAHESALKAIEEDLAATPWDPKKWLELLDVTLSTSVSTTKNVVKARSDITLAVLSRAFTTHAELARNKLLRILYLKAGEEIWDKDKLRSEWEEAFRTEDPQIQIEWLEWKIRNASGIDGIVESASAAMHALSKESRLRAFYRTACAIRSAGYSERAMAMFQAQAELAFKTPASLASRPFEDRLNSLEEFWDSEHLRLGEVDAVGWNYWFSSAQQTPPPPSRPATTVSIPDLDAYRQWAREEVEFDRQSLLPTRSDSDSADPYSTILFTDIRPLLSPIETTQEKHEFRLAWLHFLGLQLPGFALTASQEVDWDDRWNLDFVGQPSFLNLFFPKDANPRPSLPDSVAGALVGKEQTYSVPFPPIKSWGKGVRDALDLTFTTVSKSRGLWDAPQLHSVDQSIVRTVFRQLRFGADDIEWDSLALAFEATLNIKTALKLSKSFLSLNQHSLRHWAAHAQLECSRGKLDEARKVYHAVLMASKPKASQTEAVLLWWNWLEMEWLAGADQAALNVILSSVGIQGQGSGVTLLRARRALDDNIESARASERWKEREAWVKLRVLVDILTGPLTNALGVGDQYLLRETSEPARESLTTALLLMVFYYGSVLKRPMQPAAMQLRATQALEAYPSNSLVIGVFLEANKGQGVWGAVRNIVGNKGPRTKDVPRRLAEVWMATWREGQWVNEVERTRSGLANAVDHVRTSSSPVLWRVYLEFEIRAKQPYRAKKLLYRAIGQCPYSKELYLLAFGPLRGVFQRHELNALAEGMAERGIRLYQGLDEVLRTVDIVENKEKDSDEDLDEIEASAREIRRLRPY